MNTREQTTCPILGPAEDLPSIRLPTVADVMKYYNFIRYSQKQGKKEPHLNEAVPLVVHKVVNIWQSASIPTVSKERITVLIKQLLEKYTKIRKNVSQGTPFYSITFVKAQTLARADIEQVIRIIFKLLYSIILSRTGFGYVLFNFSIFHKELFY